jgi:hypothetical protein
MASIASIASMVGKPRLGNVNSSPPFSFKASGGPRRDYGNKPTVSALQNPTLHNNVPEVMVNGTARAPLFVRPFTRGYEKAYSEGDILFVKKDERSSGGQHHVVANLPVMNYLLRTEKDLADKDGKKLAYNSVDKILKDWNYFGILNNDMDTGSKWQRLLNVNVRGRSRVARLWQPEKGRLRKGDCVWIGIVERTSHKSKIETIPSPLGSRVPIERNVKYFEVVPLMDCCKEFDEAEFKLPVGIVSQVTLRQPHSSALSEALYVTETCKSLERIEVLMRI